MMQLYKIDGNTVNIVSYPSEKVGRGDYLLAEDIENNKALILQVINSGYANVPGILEEILRTSSTENLEGVDLDPLEMKSFVNIIKDAELLTCKIRGAIKEGKLSIDTSWIPPRTASKLKKISDSKLLEILEVDEKNSILMGVSNDGSKVKIDINSIDGKLNIITGKKGTGKSHLAKLLLLRLVSKGGECVVFDINGEYINLGYKKNEEKTKLHQRFITLTPGKNFRVTPRYAGLGVLIRIMENVLDLPSTSSWEFRRIWRVLRDNKALTIDNIHKAIRSISNNYIQDALLRRFENLVNTNFFTDEPTEAIEIETIVQRLNEGGAIIINLQNTTSKFRQIVVEFTLSKLSQLLESWKIRAVFLFAEEAHLYLRDTYWNDVVTRMRHIGMFTTFITNQPDSVGGSVYRQADNVFLFNFTNERDLEIVSRASMVDAETVNIIARQLPPRHCLVLGKVLKDFPFILKVDHLSEKTLGRTRLFFTQH